MAKTNESVSYESLLKAFKAGKLPPVLFMYGEEPFYMDQLANWLEKNAVEESQQGFNQTVLYGRDVDAGQIINASRRFPMMYSHQLVLIKEAQNITEAELEKLIPYFNKPLDTTVLVICYKGKTLDKRKKLYKSLEDAAKSTGKVFVFQSNKEKDYQINKWIAAYVVSQGFQINQQTADLLAEYLGNDLEKIANEIGKLAINIAAGSTITNELVEKYIGISKEYNVFELQKAIGEKNIFKAFQIAQFFGESPKAANFSMPMCIGNLYQLFYKLYLLHHNAGKEQDFLAKLIGIHPYFFKEYNLYTRNYSLARVKRNIGILLEYDLKSKGYGSSATDDGELLKELIYKLVA
jgi:DNA polymerase-3 subunit delta